ncbi:hypothetical protein P7K49_015821 [Saguinus oedipus]|uniref:Uncharacterized protein n=1 Tax=Saguinus oedipus TaxID=9490 RepID=A0ABQ9VAA8_SAGOE|nr:hypothetical protein P7K49_015821 [Saguinus oedipus]
MSEGGGGRPPLPSSEPVVQRPPPVAGADWRPPPGHVVRAAGASEEPAAAPGSQSSGRGERADAGSWAGEAQRQRGDRRTAAGGVGAAASAFARPSRRVPAPRAHTMEPAPSAGAELQPTLLANASDTYPSAFPSTGANASGAPGERSASSLALAIAITALYSAVCAVGLLGNLLVMFGIRWGPG